MLGFPLLLTWSLSSCYSPGLSPPTWQSARDLSQISDLQAQLEEAIKDKQEVQEKVTGLSTYSLDQWFPNWGYQWDKPQGQNSLFTDWTVKQIKQCNITVTNNK